MARGIQKGEALPFVSYISSSWVDWWEFRPWWRPPHESAAFDGKIQGIYWSTLLIRVVWHESSQRWNRCNFGIVLVNTSSFSDRGPACFFYQGLCLSFPPLCLEWPYSRNTLVFTLLISAIVVLQIQVADLYTGHILIPFTRWDAVFTCSSLKIYIITFWFKSSKGYPINLL